MENVDDDYNGKVIEYKEVDDNEIDDDEVNMVGDCIEKVAVYNEIDDDDAVN